MVVEDHPAGCPCCDSTARYALRTIRRDALPGDGRQQLVRRRVLCVDCGCRYTLLSWERRGRDPSDDPDPGRVTTLRAGS